MSTPSLFPAPQVQTPAPADGSVPPDKETQLKNLLLLPEFHALNADTQRQILAERYNSGIGQLNNNELSQWKQLKAQKLGVQLPKIAYQPMQSNKDLAIEFARPFVSDAVGAGAGLLAGPETLGAASGPVGIAAKTGVDALLQKMEDQPPQGPTSAALGLTPGGVGSTLTNSAEMLGTNAVLGKVVGTIASKLKSLFSSGLDSAGAPLTQEARDAIAGNVAKLEDHANTLNDINSQNDLIHAKHVRNISTINDANDALKSQYQDAVDRATQSRSLQEAARASQIKRVTDLNANAQAQYESDLADYQDELAKWNKSAKAGKGEIPKPTPPDQPTPRLVPQELSPATPVKEPNYKTLPDSPNYKPLPQAPDLDPVPQVGSFGSELHKNILNEAQNAWKEHILLRGAVIPAALLAGTGHGEAAAILGAGYTGLKVSKALSKTLLENPNTAGVMQALATGSPLTSIEEGSVKALKDALQGASIVATGPKGERSGTIQNGEFIPLK